MKLQRLSLVMALTALMFIMGTAQINYPTGWYPANSLFIEVANKPGLTAFISVNCFSTGCMQPYTSGFWVYPRTDTMAITDWENQQFTKGPLLPWQGNIDTMPGHRGTSPRVNVIIVEYRNSGGAVIERHVSNIRLGGVLHRIPVVYITVDSLEAFGPHGFYGPGEGLVDSEGDQFWNYHLNSDFGVPRSRYEKPCNVQIVDVDNTVDVNMVAGVRISAGSTANVPDRTMSVIPRNDYGSASMTHHLFGDACDVRSLKLRTRPDWDFGSNEAGLALLKGQSFGGMEYAPVAVYLNGTFWTIAFGQEKADKYGMARINGWKKGDVVVVNPGTPLNWTAIVEQLTNQGVNIDSLIEASGIDTALIAFIQGPDGVYAVADLESTSDKQEVEGWFQRFMDSLAWHPQLVTAEGSDRIIESLIDMDGYAKYIASCHFMNNGDAAGNNLEWLLVGGKLHPVASDYDVWGSASPCYNMFNDTLPGSYSFMASAQEGQFNFFVLHKLLLGNPRMRELLVLAYQDMLNTAFRPSVTAQVPWSVYTPEVMGEYLHLKASWPTLASADSLGLAINAYQLGEYLADRPACVISTLPDVFGEIDPLRSRVSLVFDSIPSASVTVKLNTLLLDTTYNGAYFHAPPVRLRGVSAPAGYETYIKEHPDSSLAKGFEVLLASDTVLTVLLRAAPVSSIAEAGSKDVVMYPNPTKGSLYLSGVHGIYTVRVMSLTGQEIARFENQAILSLGDLSPGMYAVEVTGERFKKIERIIINQ